MAYLSPDQYVDRYGERETALLTNDTTPQAGGVTSYDADALQTALDDATEEVDSYIGGRYAIPLAEVPPIVRGWVAAIARLKLYEKSTRVNPNVKEAADRATRQLEQLVARKLNLPIAEGDDAPAEVGSGDSMTSGDGAYPVFAGHRLDGYTQPFLNSYGCLPNWRRGC